MLSLPVVTDTSPYTVFSALSGTWYLFLWDPVTFSYQGKEQISLQVGVGYWLKAPNTQTVTISGAPFANSQLELPLSQGWNLIGYPYLNPSTWSSPRIEYLGSLYTLDQAAAGGIIIAYAFTWNGTSYDDVKTLGSFLAGKGYWLKALQGCTLIFFHP
jgi:hypothetical protein